MFIDSVVLKIKIKNCKLLGKALGTLSKCPALHI